MKTLLLILDGFGYRMEKKDNAILLANTTLIKDIYKPKYTIKANGKYVGLLENQLSGSEIGHITIGAGRIVNYIGSKWGKLINSDEFENTDVYKKLINVLNISKRLHLIGMLSNGGVHSDILHLQLLIDKFSLIEDINIYLHLISDGRDMPKRSVNILLEKLDLKKSIIASLGGRYYAMDRDNNIDRTKKYFNVICNNSNIENINIFDYIQLQYNKGINDEFIEPVLFNKNGSILKDDCILFFNFRSDRMRQIVKMFDENKYNIFTASKYYPELNDDVIFVKQEIISDVLSEKLSKYGIKQLKLAETEKYAHVTKFFNGEKFDKFNNEVWNMIPSPKVPTYDLKPEMSIYEITDYLLTEYYKYDFVLCNFANADMVGHTGNIDAAIKAVEHIDICLQKILNELLKNKWNIVVTADHGNCDIMSGDFQTTHTFSDVPLWLFKDEINLEYTENIFNNYNPISITDIRSLIEINLK